MPGVKAEEDRDSPLLTNGGGKNGDGSSHRKSKSDDSASFLRAARGGNTEKVLEYLKNGTDINTCNANGLNALHLASKEGHVHIVQDLLARGAKIDSATKKGNTALHIASLAGQHEVVKILVSHSASVNVQSQNGFTPLYMAAQENHDEVVRFLLASGASQSLATEDGFTPLAVALQQGHDKVVAVLLENDTRGKVRLPALHIAAKKDDTKAAALLLQNDHNPDVTSKSGFTPLHIAAHYGNENIAVVLLQRGADVNYSAKHNITPLHVAAKWGKGNMVGLLLDKGANLEARTRDGLTPLHCAARSGHENVVDMMLQRGAPISAKTKNGLAPLHMASQGDHVDAARILLHHKAPVDEVTVDYLTALHVAAHCGHVRVAKLLLDRKADPNSRALNGFTPLHIACKKNRIKVVELLLKYGASIEATTESGLTPLHVASFMGCMNIVIFLIQHQASPDEATVRGETPLHLAARANQTDIIRILLRNGAKVDARAREQQTPLHIASRLGNVDIVVLLLQSGAQVDAVTKDLYTALHIAAKEGQEEVAAILMDHGASMSAATKKGFTPLHLSAKYGNMKVAKLLIAKDAPVDAEGKNGVTPLHVAVHYDNQNVAMLLLDKSASPHACAKNGYTPLHISAKKNQLDIAKTLLDYGAKVDAESKAGFSPLHLAGQEGHIEIATLLIKQGADVNAKAKNGLTPIHLCAQEDKVDVAQVLVENGADCDAETKAGYTPLHVAAHFGQMNMVKFLLGQDVRVDVQNELGYSPLHQAAQQGHSQIVNLLLEANASPNTVSNNGQTALSIAQKLGYISVVETLKVVTDTVVTTTTTTTVEEKYKVLAPESMQETFMSDSEDEGGEEPTNDQSYKYLTTEEMLKIPDDSMQVDITSDTLEKKDSMNRSTADPHQLSIEQTLIRMENSKDKPDFGRKFDEDYKSDNVALSIPPVSAGFLVSFMVDARGGAMRGCRHSGVRVIIPPRKAPMPMRITCRYLKKDKLIHPPPLMEGEAIASRVLELGPAGAKFLGPVIIEVPHFASLRGKEREIVILRSDNGESWREHTLEATEEAVQDVLQDSFDEGETTQLEDLNTTRITRILTTDFPQYFAIISRIRQEVHAIGPEGGVVNSTVVPQVQAVFPQGALTKKIKVGLQAQPIPPELTAKLLGNRVAVSPIVTVEPRRRKFHKPITLTIPVPVAASKGMINQYSGDTPTLRLLCSITGGTTRAQWEDVTGSTPLTFVNDCVNFTTTVSARFWLMDCRNVAEATKMATTLYKEAIHVPFMAKFCVFSKRHELLEARMRVFCMTDDKEDKTLEHQEHFHEVAKSRDVEVLEGKTHHLEFFGNLFPVTKSGDQLSHKFHAFRENRLPFNVRVKDPNNDPLGRISFFREPKQARGEAQQTSICNLNISLPDDISPEPGHVTDQDILAIQAKYSFLREAGYGKFDTIHRADLRVSDISNLLGSDWVKLARELEIEDQDINLIISEYPDNVGQQAMVMLRLWLNTEGNKATGNALEKALKKCDRQDIVNKCMFNIEMVTDNAEQELAQSELAREEGFDAFKKELSPVNNSTMKPLTRDYSIDVNVDDTEYAHENFVAAERLAGITEEISSRSDTINETSLKHEEATSVYEREEQKYVAEEKEFASSYHKEVQQEQMSTNQITQSQVLETKQTENNIITERTENRNDYVHEEMKKMSIDEKQSMKIMDGDRVMEKTTESKMEEEHKEKEMYNKEMSETKQSKTEEQQDGTVLILTENKKQSREEFMTESHESRHYEQAEIMTGMETSETVRVTESKFQSEMFDQGLEEQFSANIERTIETSEQAGTTSPSQPRPASSSFDDEDSEPESPRSPSPKVSPGSKSPSPRVSQHNSHPDLLRQTSSPYGGSSGASSHGSSRNDLDDMPNNDVAPLMKETDQELLDEMIVKDVPESESSTDPVKKFEEAHPSASIDSIQEDQEDASDSECKDQSLNILALATSTPHKSHDTLSLTKSSSDPSPEMPHESDIKDEDDKSPLTSGLAAPDSKDSLEVQLYSNCEDLSEHFSGREESIDDMKQRPDSSDSEDEREPTVNEKDISPVVESIDFNIEDDIEKKEGFEFIQTIEESKFVKEKSINSVSVQQKQTGFELIKKTEESKFIKAESVKSVADSSSDEEYEIVNKKDIIEAVQSTNTTVQQQKAQINIQSASSSDTESESDHEKSRHSSADHSETSDNKDTVEFQDEAPVFPDTRTTTDTESIGSRPTSSDFTEIYRKQEFHPSIKKNAIVPQDSPVILRSQKISADKALKPAPSFSRPSSSDYSDIDHHPEISQDMTNASVKNKISIFNQEPSNVDSGTSRPSSSDFSEAVDKKTVLESDTEGNSETAEDLVIIKSVKDKISKFNLEPAVSKDTDEFTINKEVEKPTESVRDRISKFNLESTMSSETEPEIEQNNSGPSSSDFSEIYDNQPINEPIKEIYARKTMIEPVKEEIQKEEELIKHVESIKQKITKFNLESTMSSETEPEIDHKISRPSSSDYSETYEKKIIIEPVKEGNHEKEELIKPVESIQEKISKFNLQLTMSSETEPEIEHKNSIPSSSDFSEMIMEKEEIVASVKDKISKFNLESTVSSEMEPDIEDKHSRPSSSDYSDIIEKKAVFESKVNSINNDGRQTDLFVSTDKTTKLNFESATSSDTEPESDHRSSRPVSSDVSEMFDRKTLIQMKTEQTNEDNEKNELTKSVKDKISKFNLESTLSSETEPEMEQRHSRPSSSDYSDINEKKAVFECKKETKNKFEKQTDIVVSETKKTTKFNLESSTSSDTEPEQEQEQDNRRSRRSSSDYSEISDKKQIIDNKNEDISEATEHTDTIVGVSVKEKISELKLRSGNSTDSEPEPYRKPSRPSSSDYSEICDRKPELEINKKEISEAVKEKISELKLESETSTDTEPKQSRPTSSDYSDIYDKEKIIESQIEVKNEIVSDPKKQELVEKIMVNEEKIKFEPGILQVTIYKALDLVNQDMLGKSDPYVKLKFRGQEFRSKTINNSLAPEWNFSTDLLISEVHDSNIIIEVYDEDYGQDNFEGSLSLSLSDAMNNSKEEGDWYNLINCKQGKIFVATIYTAMSSSQGSLKAFATPDIEISRPRAYSTSSSSSEEGLTKDQTNVMQQSSTDSSISNKKEKSNDEIQRQDAIDIEDKLIESKKIPLKAQSSSDYSDTDVEQKRRESSSDYDSVSNRGKKRPDSFISDTSSDYDSLSNVGSRRPQSFILDDEYDIITEEEAAESEKHSKIETSTKHENDTSSSSESEGPDVKEAGKPVEVIPPPDVQKKSSIEDKEHDGEFNGISVPQTLEIPYPTHSSVASSSPILSSDLHAEQSSISVEVEKSTVINSNTLEEIDPLVRDFENISHSNNFTKNNDAKTEKRNILEEPRVASSVSFQSTSRRSSSSCSSLDQAQRDGSSESERSQEQESSKKPSSK